MNQAVGILSSKKTDGRYNRGTIVGIELQHDGSLWCMTQKDFVSQFKQARYKVAFTDVFTTRSSAEWFQEHELCIPKDLPKGES